MLVSMQRTWVSHTLLVRLQNGVAALENSSAVPYKTTPTATIQPTGPLLSIYPREIRIYIHIKTCRQMSVVVLLMNSWTLETTQMTFRGGW